MYFKIKKEEVKQIYYLMVKNYKLYQIWSILELF